MATIGYLIFSGLDIIFIADSRYCDIRLRFSKTYMTRVERDKGA